MPHTYVRDERGALAQRVIVDLHTRQCFVHRDPLSPTPDHVIVYARSEGGALYGPPLVAFRESPTP